MDRCCQHTDPLSFRVFTDRSQLVAHPFFPVGSFRDGGWGELKCTKIERGGDGEGFRVLIGIVKS